MAVNQVSVTEFIELRKKHLVIDVRSPSEYNHAHIPQAFPLPLFDDEERKVVGTTYKQKSREEAIKVGLDFYGPKLRQMVSLVESELSRRGDRTVIVHCWRGGMRSAAVAWLLDLYGYHVYTLIGGYKTFRRWVIEQFQNEYKLIVLSGNTGSGKTDILHEMHRLGNKVIDLEGLAGHKGSAFGGIGCAPQISSEQFENLLALQLFELSGNKLPIWIESESNRIGDVNIPQPFFIQMRKSSCVNILVSLQQRLDRIYRDYGAASLEELETSVQRIRKRLGGLETKNTITFLKKGKYREAFEILIKYYDKFYENSDLFQKPFMEITLQDTDASVNAKLILEKIKHLIE